MAAEREDRIYDDELDLRELFSVLWRRKWIIIGMVIIMVLLALGWTIATSKNYTESLIQLNFSGIDKHLYPDETRFEMHDIIAQDILSVAANALDNAEHRELFTSNPRSFIFIDPFIPIEVKEKMKAMERDKQTYVYLPNQFFVRFVQPRGEVFSHDERKRVLLAINRAYEDKFVKEYVNQKLVALNLTPDILDGYDYGEVVDIFKSYVDTYISYLNNMTKNAGLYRSSQTGLSFVDLLDSLDNIRKIDLYEIESILKVSLETKQKEALLKKYQYRIKSLDKEMQKKHEEAASAKTLLDEVWRQEKGGNSLDIGSTSQTAPQILVDASVLDKLSGKEYKAVLLQRALDSEVAASSLRIDKKFLEDEITLLKSEKNEGSNPGISIEFIQNSLEGIRKHILALGGKANELSAEFLAKRYSGIIKVLKNPVSATQYGKSPVVVFALSFVMSLILGIFIAFIVEYVRTSRKETEAGN